MMNFEEFRDSLARSNPPGGLSVHLQSLWYDARNDWNEAHEIIQDVEDSDGSWIHAYLHRKEGDLGNADYWYRKAGRQRPDESLLEEWSVIVKSMLR